MEDLILKRIGSLITQHSGICIREQDYRLLSDKLWRRTQALGLASLAHYHDYLVRELAPYSGGTPSQGEWQSLYSILTVNESYFFRDSNQFRLLSDRLLPDIIQRNRLAAEATGTKPRLRLWSAGCSTGEELYSLAIALTELGFAWDQWDTLLVGTDLSPQAIDSARKGIYGNWSFRQIVPTLKHKYFHPHHQLYKISDSIRQRVVFHCGNLLSDDAPGPGSLSDLDLILCRNVFIYLDSQAIGQIIQRFHRALGSQGYLLTGHTELYSQDTSQFQTLSFPESVVYRKPLAEVLAPVRGSIASASTSAPIHPPQPRPSRTVPSAADRGVAQALAKALQDAESLLQQKAYASAIQRATALYAAYPHCDAARKIAAQAYANSGFYTQATQLCHQVIDRQPLSVDMYYLLAQIAEDQNDLETSKEYLRKIIYLDANHVRAYLDLASIYEREKQPEKTQKMHNQALALLADLPPDAVLDSSTTTTVAEWQAYLAKKVPSLER
jgi:chemotaxis protein methyltransferase CheR